MGKMNESGKTKKWLNVLSVICVLGCSSVYADDSIEAAGLAAIKQMAGCFLVDYNYHETESLKEGYSLDARTYDPNRSGASVKEWIQVIEKRPHEIRLQHILFATDHEAKTSFMLKHQAEDWEFQPASFYNFEAPGFWRFTKVEASGGKWLRKITHLDDGPRYQCLAEWNLKSQYPSWTCKNYAPIPGRETRDMRRKDYQTLDRDTTLILYGDSWLERQENIKVIDDGQSKVPLAKETGKNWYIRLPDSSCLEAQNWSAPRQAYWRVLMNAWDQVYSQQRDIRELSVKGPPRYAKVAEVEERSFAGLNDGTLNEESVQREILDTIASYLQP